MKSYPRPFTLAAVSLVCIFLLAACTSGPAVLRYITITPATATISVNTTQQFAAQAYYSDGSVQDATSLVLWSSSNTAVATITAAGVATGVGFGTTTIRATAAGTTGASAVLNVNQLKSIMVSPTTATVVAGGSQPFTATGTYTMPNGSTGSTDITTLVTWAATPASVATITSGTGGGVATVAATATPGSSATITATLDNVVSTPPAILTVGAPVPVSLQVSPATPTIAIGNTEAFTAQEVWSDGSLHTPSGAVTWASGTTTTATIIANSGIALGLAVGTSTIMATEGTLTPGTATLNVVAAKALFAYVSNGAGNTIQWYSVSTTTSPYLTSPAQDTLTIASGAPPSTQTVIHPSDQYLYYTDFASDVWVTTINSSTGALTPSAFPSQLAGSGHTNFMVIDPYGRFLYVSDDGGGAPPYTIYGFTINQMNGSLTAIPGSPFTTNLNVPECLIIDHTGTYLYATNQGNNTISAYTINQTTGALTPLSTPTFSTGNGPYLGGLDPSGTQLYVADTADNTIAGFTIGTGGALTAIGSAPFTVTGAITIENLVVDPSGTHIYVLDQGNGTTNGQVFGFSIGSGGVIGSAISGTPIATGVNPLAGIVIDPTGALLAVENNTSDTISLYTIGSGGVLTAATPVATGSGPFFVTFYNAP